MMISEQNIGEWAEKYRSGTLSTAEKNELEQILSQNPVLKEAWIETLELFDLLGQKATSNTIRQTIVHAQSQFEKQNQQTDTHTENKTIFGQFGSSVYMKFAAIAASLVLVSSLLTIFISKQNNKSGNQYTLLRREIENIKNSQSQIIDSIQKQNVNTKYAQLKYGGTGFALSNNGYLATNYHVVKDANGIYVQTAEDQNQKAYIVAFDAKSDIAILKIQSQEFNFASKPLPYALSKVPSDLGQKVFSLGYPQDELVYNEGYISSEKGFNRDSTSYQLEMISNPGQSGAPVLDQNGNIIALITGKKSNTTGTTYAVQTEALIDLIQSLPDFTQKNIALPQSNSVARKSRTEQIKQIRPYVFSVKVN